MDQQFKILIANYRYFLSGGPERYMFTIMEGFEARGHRVIPFSVAYQQNKETPYKKYFVSAPGDGSQVYFKDLTLSTSEKIKLAFKSIYSLEAKSKIEKLIQDELPDFVYLLMLHNVLTPSVIDGAARHSVPVVMRLSEYHLMCPAYHFFRNGHICEDCHKGYYYAIKNSCIHNSKMASTVKAVGRYFYNFIKVYDKVSMFITPSQFLRNKLIEYELDGQRIRHIPTFIDSANYKPCFDHQNYIVYFGRITREKGVFELIQAVEPLKIRLLIVGNSTDDEDVRLQSYVFERNLDHIKFLGFKDQKEAHEIIRGAMFTVCPSIWYENTPISIYESFALGKPVIATNIGSIPEQIDPGRDGLLFELGNIQDLREKILWLASRKKLISEMGYNARKKIEECYNFENHYNKLMEVFGEIV